MDTKDIHQTAALRRETKLSKLARDASAIVQQQIDLKTAKAIWDFRKDDRGRPVLALRVEDRFGAEATAEFAPEELRLDQHFGRRLSDMKFAALVVGKWRQQLRGLFDTFRSWLDAFKPTPFIEEGDVTLREQPSGPYAVPVMTVSLGTKKATIEPVAAWVVGANGRVDLRGPSDEFTFLLQGEKWLWVDDRPPGRLTPLTKDIFLELIRFALQ